MVRAVFVLMLAAGAAYADQTPPTKAQLAEKAARRFPQPVQVGVLLHRDVLAASENQAVLGHLATVVREADGSIDAVIDYGGLFGIGSHLIAVPMDAMVLVGADMEVADFKPAELARFPTFTGAGTPLQPNEVIQVGLAKPSH